MDVDADGVIASPGAERDALSVALHELRLAAAPRSGAGAGAGERAAEAEAQLDGDGDGAVSRAELAAALQRQLPATSDVSPAQLRVAVQPLLAYGAADDALFAFLQSFVDGAAELTELAASADAAAADGGATVETAVPAVVEAAVSDVRRRPLRRRRRLLDTYGDSLVHVDTLYNIEFGKPAARRRVPAHMPHFINREQMSRLQEHWPREFAATSRHRFRSSKDIQFAFAYFHWLLNNARTRARDAAFDLRHYWQTEIDTDGACMILSPFSLFRLLLTFLLSFFAQVTAFSRSASCARSRPS
jgi:hypothetical protein